MKRDSMAIGFARLEFVKRSSGKTACAKAAYNGREKIHFEGNCVVEAKTYDWSYKEKPVYHEVLLPPHASKKFTSPEMLWNTVEKSETRKDSQVAIEVVLALPDDKAISLEDKKALTKLFVEDHFTKQGFAVQVDIHPPDRKGEYSEETGKLEKKEHNWHAHLLIPTRRFSETGESLELKKPRDLMPTIRRGNVIAGPNWGKLWTQCQNEFFEAKGLNLRVDSSGVVPQVHLGPVRMRGRAFELFDQQDQRIELNKKECQSPDKILEKITESKSVFEAQDLKNFLTKFVDPQNRTQVEEKFWDQKSLIQLFDPSSLKPLPKFSSVQAVREERKVLRLASHIASSKHKKIDSASPENLTLEQQSAYQKILSSSNLSLLQGHAGTGKSYLLLALSKAYQSNGYHVRSFGPDNATSKVLKEKGLDNPENVYQFLFRQHYKSNRIRKGKEVWIVDESGKLGNGPLLELLKMADKNQVKLILSGDSSQLPSISRGGMFQKLCEVHGFSSLTNIQRQKFEEQREASKNLASGEVSYALDQIHRSGGFLFAATKKEAIEELITKWGSDQQSFPNGTSLIVANSNAEVKVLNELVRSYRKEKGEISSKEFECETASGKLFVSEGDVIEFRKNDKKLNVNNGTQGILTKSSPKKFEVTIKENGKARRVSFKPKSYNSFQLGYATTYYRSQGRTVDRAYILHSPRMNKEMFYVGLTRHVRAVTCFVPRTCASSLLALKKQAMLSSKKETTLDYITQIEIAQQKKEKKLSELATSDSMTDRAKAFGLSTWQSAKSSIGKRLDRVSDKEFFNPELSQESHAGRVTEVKEETIKIDRKIPLPEKLSSTVSSLQKITPFQTLPKEHQKLLKDYYSKSDEASNLYLISKNAPEKGGSWKRACALRNESAYKVCHSIPSTTIKKQMSSKGLLILEDRSATHERTSSPKENLEEGLLTYIEPLLYRLFPEGHSRKDATGFRFGSKGSLSVTCTGAKAGTFYDFEQGEGGGLLTLIQKNEDLDYKGAKDWARDFLGKSTHISIPKAYSLNQLPTRKEESWICSSPPSEKLPNLKEVSPYIAKNYTPSAWHAYRDEKGELLFYTVRLYEKGNPSKKIVLPLSYGQDPEKNQDFHWKFKGYTASGSKTPLYNLHLLDNKKPVLIVEGEKAADAGNQLFKAQYICVSWIGGAGGVKRADWESLFGKNVVIWPDNDQAGYKASSDICEQLRKVGVLSLKEVDASKLPEKWDIADPVPENLGKNFLKDSILRAQSKAVGLERLIPLQKETHIDLKTLNSITADIDSKFRPELEQKLGGKSWEIEREIMSEVRSFIKSKKEFSLEGERSVDLSKLQVHLERHSVRGNDRESLER